MFNQNPSTSCRGTPVFMFFGVRNGYSRASRSYIASKCIPAKNRKKDMLFRLSGTHYTSIDSASSTKISSAWYYRDLPSQRGEPCSPLAILRPILLFQGPKVTPAVAITTARKLIVVALVIVRCTLRIASATISHHPELPLHLSCRIMSINTSPVDSQNSSRRPLFLYILAPTPNDLLALALVAGSRQEGNPRSCTP